MKIIKISLLSILLWSCAQQVSLYPEGITKELITISIPDTNMPLQILRNPEGAEILLRFNLNRSLDEFENRLNSKKKIKYALHIIKTIEGKRYYNAPRNIFTLTDSIGSTTVFLNQPFNLPQGWRIQKSNTRAIMGFITFYYKCAYTDVNNKKHEEIVTNKLVVPAVYSINYRF